MRLRCAALRICVELVGESVDFDLAFLDYNVFLLEGDVLSDLLSASALGCTLGLRFLHFDTLLAYHWRARQR
jgi:hypothetical protein